MLIKTKIQLSKKITAIFFTVFLLVGFLNFGNLPKAQAACNYTLNLTTSTPNVTNTGEVKLHVEATSSTSGNTLSSSCATGIRVDFQYKVTKGFLSAGTYTTLDTKTFPFSGGKASGDYTVNMRSRYGSIKSDLSDPNTILFEAFGYFIGDGTSKRSSEIPVKVSGSTGATGGSISASLSPLKAMYEEGDSFTINTSATALRVNSTASNFYVAYKVDNQLVQDGKVVKSTILSGFDSKPIVVNEGNKFKSSTPAVVRVEIWEDGTTNQVAFYERTIQVGVFKNGGTVNKLVNGATCSSSSACQSNFCDDTAGVCSACSSNSDCTQNYNCSNGVCISSTTSGTPNDGSRPPASGTDILYNPLPVDNLTATLLLIAKGFLGVIAIWASVFIVVGGFQMVMSAGNEEAVLKAKKTITWAVLGLVVAIMSFSIVAIVQNLFKATVKEVPLGYEISVTKNIV